MRLTVGIDVGTVRVQQNQADPRLRLAADDHQVPHACDEGGPRALAKRTPIVGRGDEHVMVEPILVRPPITQYEAGIEPIMDAQETHAVTAAPTPACGRVAAAGAHANMARKLPNARYRNKDSRPRRAK